MELTVERHLGVRYRGWGTITALAALLGRDKKLS